MKLYVSVRAIGVVCLISVVPLVTVVSPAEAGDWPQWRYDAGRTAVSPDPLPRKLHLQWVRRLPAPRPAWPGSQQKLQFDASYEPVVMGKVMFVGSMVRDSVTAYETETGAEKWRFYTEGPVRFAPVAYKNKVYVVSDDGHLYCLAARSGKLLWKLSGGPAVRRVIGNDRLVSMWPARGGPVLYEGKLYFAASIWPFMGTFIHAIDAETGKSVWTNSGSGSRWQKQQHSGSVSFAGVAPQGYLAATAERLLVSGGRTVPACYDRKTGKFMYYHVSSRQFGRDAGGYGVTILGKYFFNRGAAYELDKGEGLCWTSGEVCAPEAIYSVHESKLAASDYKPTKIYHRDRRGRRISKVAFKPLWEAPLENAPQRIFIKAGGCLYCGGEDGSIAAVDVSRPGKPVISWRGKVEGAVWNMLAADNKLFVVTLEGSIYCFGARAGRPKTHATGRAALGAAGGKWANRAKEAIAAAGTDAGYCVAMGLGTGRLVEQIIRQSRFHVIVVDKDAAKIDAFRRGMDGAGLYGQRVAALADDPFACRLPPYLANLVVCETPIPTPGQKLRNWVRPYGGVICAPDAGGRMRVVLRRSGPLPGSAAWTHQYGDSANSVLSRDRLVKAPLGLLWFGGPPNDPILPRHGHGPSPQVIGGRLFIEGRSLLRAVDVYTGRVLWEKPMRDIGFYYRHTDHHPGAGDIGSNYVSLADGIYIMSPDACMRLDPATGRTLSTFSLPARTGRRRAHWGSILLWKDLLVATSSPISVITVPVIRPGGTWRYLAAAHPAGDWTRTDFDDEEWESGRAGFGYGDRDDDEKTVLKDMKGRYRVVYIRGAFEVESVRRFSRLNLKIRYDDAFIAHLNGREILRVGVAGGSGAKASGIREHEAKDYETFEISNPSALLRAGTNVLAIEGHNVSKDDDDFSLHPFLVVPGLEEPKRKKGKPETRPAAALKDIPGVTIDDRYGSSSRMLVVMDRHGGKVLWTRRAAYNFRHNAIAVAAGKVFCIDGMSERKFKWLQRRGLAAAAKPTLYALDARTGKVVWKTDQDVFGTWLGYSAEHDVLLQAGSRYRDRADDDIGEGMVVYRAASGEVVWKDLKLKYGGPPMLRHGTIITNGSGGFGIGLLTGKRTMRKHPLTGRKVPWTWSRYYGCNTAVAGEHLLTFRSGAAGYFDLTANGGTGNLGGFKSGCTSNLIAADGVLSAPDYTRTCTCSYQNQSSLALVHMPDAEMWTFNRIGAAPKLTSKPAPATIRRVGINLGAPGDRLAENGTLWLDHPSGGSPSPAVPVEVEPDAPEYFRHHALLFKGRGLTWVGASGVTGAERVTIGLADKKAKAPAWPWTVRLVFAEPDAGARAGDRVFSVLLQGKAVLTDFDPVKSTGRPRRVIVKEFKGIEAARELKIELKPRSGETLLCGVELVADGGEKAEEIP